MDVVEGKDDRLVGELQSGIDRSIDFLEHFVKENRQNRSFPSSSILRTIRGQEGYSIEVVEASFPFFVLDPIAKAKYCFELSVCTAKESILNSPNDVDEFLLSSSLLSMLKMRFILNKVLVSHLFMANLSPMHRALIE